MKQPRLTLGKAVLLMVGLGTGALMGVPGFGVAVPPKGPIEGLVRSDRGAGLAGAEVVLFDHHTLQPLELTHTDAHGRFAFGQAPARFHVFAGPPASNPDLLVGAWAYDRVPSAQGGLELQLYAGEWLTVQVVDSNDQALEAAEVRLVDPSADEPLVVQRLLTNRLGVVQLLMPPQAHLGVFASGGRPAHWLTHLKHPGSGATLRVRIPAARVASGSLLNSTDAGAPGVLVSAWDLDQGIWRGWTRTEADGSFSLPVSPAGARVRMMDPRGEHLPLELELQPEDLDGGSWTLERGEPRQVQTDPNSDSRAARVWGWSEETQAWGWGLLTDDLGRIEARLAPHHSVVALPTEPGGRPQEAWNLEWAPTPLQLQASLVEDQ